MTRFVIILQMRVIILQLRVIILQVRVIILQMRVVILQMRIIILQMLVKLFGSVRVKLKIELAVSNLNERAIFIKDL